MTESMRRMPPRAPGRLLRMAEVEREVSLERSSIYRLIREGSFPRQIRVGKRASRWSQTAIDDWKIEKMAATQPG